jgi:hypothetical protein
LTGVAALDGKPLTTPNGNGSITLRMNLKALGILSMYVFRSDELRTNIMIDIWVEKADQYIARNLLIATVRVGEQSVDLNVTAASSSLIHLDLKQA